jgi:membrane-associated phospholipid phosphatase
MYLMKGLNAFALFLAAAVLAGGGTLPNGRGWGQDATLFPGWRRVRDAAVNAVTAPATWVPAAGAIVLQVDDMDGNLADWATDHVPLFGSQEDAERATDLLNATPHASYLVTALLTPSGDKDVWLNAKLKGIGVGFAAMMATCGTTCVLKDTINLTRPDGSNDRSFPSGHASSAATATMLASKNVEHLTYPIREKPSCAPG